MSNKLLVVLHVRRVLNHSEENLIEHVFQCEDELIGRLLVREGIVRIWVEQIVSYLLDMEMVLRI